MDSFIREHLYRIIGVFLRVALHPTELRWPNCPWLRKWGVSWGRWSVFSIKSGCLRSDFSGLVLDVPPTFPLNWWNPHEPMAHQTLSVAIAMALDSHDMSRAPRSPGEDLSSAWIIWTTYIQTWSNDCAISEKKHLTSVETCWNMLKQQENDSRDHHRSISTTKYRWSLGRGNLSSGPHGRAANGANLRPRLCVPSGQVQNSHVTGVYLLYLCYPCISMCIWIY